MRLHSNVYVKVAKRDFNAIRCFKLQLRIAWCLAFIVLMPAVPELTRTVAARVAPERDRRVHRTPGESNLSSQTTGQKSRSSKEKTELVN